MKINVQDKDQEVAISFDKERFSFEELAKAFENCGFKDIEIRQVAENLFYSPLGFYMSRKTLEKFNESFKDLIVQNIRRDCDY